MKPTSLSSRLALLEVEHEFQRGRFAHSQRDIAELFERTGRCEFTSISRELLQFYPAGLEIHDALYVATARMLTTPDEPGPVAIISSDREIHAAYPHMIWN